MQLQSYKSQFIGSQIIAYWLCNLQLIYLGVSFIYQNEWSNCYILFFCYTILGQLPIKQKLPTWLNPVIMGLTTLFLFLEQHWLATATLLFSHWLQGEQPIKPKVIAFNIILIQSFWLTFLSLICAHLLTFNTTYQPQRKMHFHLRLFKPLWILMFDQVYITLLLTISVWIYLLCLPALPPNDLVFAILPSCVACYLLSRNLSNFEPFLLFGYISLSLLLGFVASVLNTYFLPNLDQWLNQPTTVNFGLLICQQLIQVCTTGAIFFAFTLQNNLFKRFSRKKGCDGFHFIYSISHMLMIILMSVWMTRLNDLLQMINYLPFLIFLGFCISMFRYPAQLLKASLKTFVQYSFKVSIDGIDNLKKVTKPYIIIPNHNSYIEPPILAAVLPGRFMFPINPEAGQMLVVRLTETFWEKLPLSPNKPMMLKPFVKGLKHGKNGVIFPEGQRSPTGKIGKIYPGVIFSAKLSQATLVPVIVSGSEYHISSRVSTNFRKSLFPKIHIQIGQPLKINSSTNIDETVIRSLLTHTQNDIKRPMHLAEAIHATIKQIGDSHIAYQSSKKKFSLKQLLNAAKKIQWRDKSYFHVTETTYNPIMCLSALLNNIPLVFGDIRHDKIDHQAIYDFTNNNVLSFSMTEIMAVIYQWINNAPIYQGEKVFMACHFDDYRLFLFGFISSILSGNRCIIPDYNTAIEQEIYLEHADVLITNTHYFNQLLEKVCIEELSMLKRTMSFVTSRSNINAWQSSFVHPVYSMTHEQKKLLTSFKSPYTEIQIT